MKHHLPRAEPNDRCETPLVKPDLWWARVDGRWLPVVAKTWVKARELFRMFPEVVGAIHTAPQWKANMYCCEHSGCTKTFDHPEDEDNCEAIDGYCAHLMGAGWRPVWVRHDGNMKGGWVCPEHVTALGIVDR